MAKKPVKEAGTALIFATVFFVITTIALGVLWYTEMNNSAEKDQAVKTKGDDAAASKNVLAEAQLDALVYRVYFGIDSPEDRTQVSGWGDKEKKRAGETIKKITQMVVEKVAKGDPTKLPSDVTFWKVEDSGLPGELPSQPLLNAIATLSTSRETAKTDADKARALWEEVSSKSKKQEANYIELAKQFEALSKALPLDFDNKLKTEFKKIEDRMKQFTETEANSRKENSQQSDKIAELNQEGQKKERNIESKDQQIRDLIAKLNMNRNEDAFINDEPQGKITRRLAEGIVEINLGSDSLVRPGLTFTVLPADFPEKGRQSRTFTMREPDERGVYRDVKRFVEKADIEVIEVLGPRLSRARVTKEYDPIRDGASQGDLLYNAVWRKGAADHIALLGVFDVNGDGTDDIEHVIRDLTKMGIPVDAYYDMRARKWVGELTQQTRFVVEGWYPVQGAFDPNRDEKTKLLGDMTTAIKEARDKGISTVKFQEFFPRMGYRVKVDTSKDKINQAVAPYLNRVSGGDSVPDGGKN